MSGSERSWQKNSVPTNIKGYHSRKLAQSRDISAMKNRHAHSRKGCAGRQGQHEARNTQGMARTAELVWLESGEEQSSETPSEAA